MYCPKCGTENPDDVQTCSSCGIILSEDSVVTKEPVPRTSALAILSFAFAVMGIFSFGLTAIPAIILGIISIVIIEKSGGKVAGRGFAVLGIVISSLVFVLLVWPVIMKERGIAFRQVCGKNLSSIGKAMFAYANDYDGKLPRSGGKNTTWGGTIAAWTAQNRFNAYGLSADGSGGRGSISSCFYLLVKYANVTPATFICPGDSGASEFKPPDEGFGDKKLTDLWDFGSAASEHCSYSYHQPFSSFPLTTSSEPGMAVAADRNPWIRSPAYEAKDIGFYNPDGSTKAIRAGNAVTHQEYGQNVLFLDVHVGFGNRPCCGVKDDNIYTFWDGGDIRCGSPPRSETKPADRLDSLLVHDAP